MTAGPATSANELYDDLIARHGGERLSPTDRETILAIVMVADRMRKAEPAEKLKAADIFARLVAQLPPPAPQPYTSQIPPIDAGMTAAQAAALYEAALREGDGAAYAFDGARQPQPEPPRPEPARPPPPREPDFADMATPSNDLPVPYEPPSPPVLREGFPKTLVAPRPPAPDPGAFRLAGASLQDVMLARHVGHPSPEPDNRLGNLRVV